MPAENRFWNCVISLIGSGLLIALILGLVQVGRMLERLEDVEEAARSYVQTIEMQGTISRDEYRDILEGLRELRDIHVREGDL